jgi:Tol biopolymer transport system component
MGWLEPVHLGCEINSEGNEFSPSYVDVRGGMLFFSSDRSGKHALYVARRGFRGGWQTPTLIAELNAEGFNTVRPNVSADGHVIVFDSDRPNGKGGFDVWYSYRFLPWGRWAAPRNAGDNINTAANEVRASLSRDLTRLYFGSTRTGNQDIYLARLQ